VKNPRAAGEAGARASPRRNRPRRYTGRMRQALKRLSLRDCMSWAAWKSTGFNRSVAINPMRMRWETRNSLFTLMEKLRQKASKR
jgi:hypothetical protein